jgi:hypothetical protein
MNQYNFSFKAEVWLWPGFSGWHFVYVPKKISDRVSLLVKTKKVKTSSNGLLPIVARVGKTEWKTSLFPHKKEKIYLMSIKSIIRKKEGVSVGNNVFMKFSLL